MGGGPAGCAAAIVLAQSGAGVVVFERSHYDGIRIGETLPPEVRLPLERLGVWDRFGQDSRHEPSPGIVSVWGGPVPHDNDFIANPYGCGWRVDRNRFDAMLAGAAEEAGAVVVRGAGVDRMPASADFVVDASGRSSTLGRAFGAERVVYDRMVALVAVLDGSPADRRALIETIEHGWWYSAPLPDGRFVCTFQTDGRPGLRARWDEFLSSAPHTAARARGSAPRTVRVVSANSHRLAPAGGQGWVAVGDAAAAHDPVSGLGIVWALESGIRGAEAIAGGTVTAYVDDARERFERYLATRARYYAMEGRWPDAPFWSRRRKHRFDATMMR